MGVRGTGDVRGQQITVARPPTGETAIAVPVVVIVDAVVGGAGYSAPGHHGARVVVGPSLVGRRAGWVAGVGCGVGAIDSRATRTVTGRDPVIVVTRTDRVPIRTGMGVRGTGDVRGQQITV